ncbi:MAG: hypothetical protein PVJ02_11495 [Gemmatimonadota bacterium]
MPRLPGRNLPSLLLAAGLLSTGSLPALGQQAPPVPASAGGAAARSFLLPGWGQHVLGQRRALVYAAVETGLWALWGNRRIATAHSRDAYRDLAWQEARLQSAVRREGAWDYYEAMSKWHASGAFDSNPDAAGVQPEMDPGTFNGSVWQLARDLNIPSGTSPPESDPAYQRALAYYEAHAYGAAFLWDWSGKDAEMARYKSLIHESDSRASQATAALGAVLANHILSGVDAYLSARIPAETHLRLEPPRGIGARRGEGWMLLLTVRPRG